MNYYLKITKLNQETLEFSNDFSNIFNLRGQISDITFSEDEYGIITQIYMELTGPDSKLRKIDRHYSSLEFSSGLLCDQVLQLIDIIMQEILIDEKENGPAIEVTKVGSQIDLISVIKTIRNHTGLGLRESRDLTNEFPIVFKVPFVYGYTIEACLKSFQFIEGVEARMCSKEEYLVHMIMKN